MIIDGVEYVQKEEVAGDYKIVRTRSAGVFAGKVVETNDLKSGVSVKMTNARRLWYWKGACSLSQLAIEGVKNPNECQFAMPVKVELFEVIEILCVAPFAKEIIEKVEIWKK